MPAGWTGSSQTLTSAQVVGVLSALSLLASRKLVQLPCITVASGEHSQRTTVEATRPVAN